MEKKASKTESGFTWIKDLPLTELEKPEVIAKVKEQHQKQLEKLKEFYIHKKVESMSHKELKLYVLEIISHQINDTIDKEEETEAWTEISDFFGEQFEQIIIEIQTK